MSKNILVTGASSGIGAEVSRYLSKQGYNVIMTARDEKKLEKQAAQLQDCKLYIPYDLSDLENIEKIFSACKAHGIKLDGLVHCAGITNYLPVRVNDVQAMKDVMTVNYFSFVELCKYFCRKKYSEEGASIVAISSMASSFCDKGMCLYASSKAALNTSVKVMAKEFIQRKIRINALLPAFVDTGMAAEFSNKVVNLDERVEKIMPFDIIPPLQIAYYVELLLSERSRYITGALLPISGGVFKKMRKEGKRDGE